jgi:tRNA-dihydrouridine synthase A
VTVKCRTGIVLKDDPEAFNDESFLHHFVDSVVNAGCERLYLHARVAVLGGLTPAQNRDIPPLTPEKGEAIKLKHPQLQVIINGGITDTATAETYLNWADGVMIGRAAYHQPRFLSELERVMFGHSDAPDEQTIVGRYIDYMANQMQAGVKLSALTKHLLHSFNGRQGARRFRQILSNASRLKANDLSLVEEALEPLGLAG